MKSTTRRDAKSGQYAHDGNWDRLCVCGHTLGIHSAQTSGGKRPCYNGDAGAPGATGEHCDCERFRRWRKKG